MQYTYTYFSVLITSKIFLRQKCDNYFVCPVNVTYFHRLYTTFACVCEKRKEGWFSNVFYYIHICIYIGICISVYKDVRVVLLGD